MKTRAITGFFFIIVMVGSMLLGATVFLLFFSLLSTWCCYEFYGIVKGDDRRPILITGIMSALAMMVIASLFYLGYVHVDYFAILFPFFIASYFVALFQKRALPFNDIAYTFLGILYVVVPFLAFISLGFVQGGFNYAVPLGFMILLWTNDTGAYLAGRSFGKRKLFERISPKKTWEGFIGGVLLAVVVALNLEKYFASLPTWQWVIIAVIIGVFGTLGDLVESMLKRSLNVKDSGTILPGHGGLLDRFDGLLVAAPLVYLFLLLLR